MGWSAWVHNDALIPWQWSTMAVANIGDMNAWKSSKSPTDLLQPQTNQVKSDGSSQWFLVTVVLRGDPHVRAAPSAAAPRPPGTRRRSTCEPARAKSCLFRRSSTRPWRNYSDSSCNGCRVVVIDAGMQGIVIDPGKEWSRCCGIVVGHILCRNHALVVERW